MPKKYQKTYACLILSFLVLFLLNCKKNPTTPAPPNPPDPNKPVIWINTFWMTFAASDAGPNPSAQTLKIKNTGKGTLSYSISNDADWLTVSETNGTSVGQIKEHTVSVDKSSLTPKEEAYTAVITVSSSGAYNSPQKVNIRLTLSEEPPPKIQVTPPDLTFTAQSGGADPAQQEIYILNTGGGTLQFTVEPDASWISANPTSGTSEDQQKTVSVSVDISTLSGGTYNGNVIISDAEASNSPQTVAVELNISEILPPEISIDPRSISFQATEGGANPSPVSIFVSNSGEGTLSYSIDWDANWLSVSPNSGQTKEAVKNHTVSTDINGLNAGAYQALITVSDSEASNSPQTVAVELNISEILPPEISIDPGSISFQAKVGGENPSPVSIFVSNSGEGTLNYSIDWDANWLSVNPNSGQTKGAARKHTASANTSGLNVGTYQALITVSDPEASNSPQTVNVTLYVSSIPTDNKVGISISPSSGSSGTIISFPISVKGNTSQIGPFGLELHFDSTMFAFQSVNSGTLTGSWAAVSGNETTAGTVVIGGFVGSGNPVPIGSLGSIAVVKLRVTCSSCSNGDTSQTTINSFTDDISGMIASPSSVKFTFNK